VSHAFVTRLTHIDHDREMALVAAEKANDGPILSVASFLHFARPDDIEAEGVRLSVRQPKAGF